MQIVNKYLSVRHVLYCEPFLGYMRYFYIGKFFLAWHFMSNSIAKRCFDVPPRGISPTSNKVSANSA